MGYPFTQSLIDPFTNEEIFVCLMLRPFVWPCSVPED